jgi:hypothetical protein
LAVLAAAAPSLTTSAASAPDIRRGQREIRAIQVRGKDDAVIAKAHFHDLGHAIGGAGVDIGLLDAARGVGDVDGGFADAFAHLLAARTRTAAFDHRGLELALFAKGFGDDGGIGQHGGRAGNLQLVTRRGNNRRGRQHRHGRGRQLQGRQFHERHLSLHQGMRKAGCPSSDARLRAIVIGFATGT